MSEPNSLFMKIKISNQEKENFLSSKLENIKKYADWIPWLQRKSYLGNITNEDIESIDYGTGTVEDYLDEYIEFPYPPENGFDEYDENNQIWIVSILQFSENYLEYISFLNVIRNLQEFMGSNSDGFALVHSYFWGDIESDFMVKIKQGESVILDGISEEYLAEAISHFGERTEYLSEKYED